MAFLAPRIRVAILEGRQLADLSLALLLRDEIPMDWREQDKLFAAD